MSTPVVGLFSDCSKETLFSLGTVLALELMQRGVKVMLVDADPALAPFSGVSGAPVPEGVSFLGLLHNPQARPLHIDCTQALGNPKVLANKGAIHLLPALAAGEAPDPRFLTHPPLQGSRRYESLRSSLCIAADQADLVLLLGPRGRSALATALLAHGCHAALLLADNNTAQVMSLAQSAREADALRGGLIPSACVELRDDGQPIPEGAWEELWRTHPSFLPPQRKGSTGPEQLLILEDSPEDPARLAQLAWDLAQRVASGVSLEPSESAFQALYQQDRPQALAMFKRDIAPRLGTRASAVAALLAVWDSPDRSWEDVQHLARFVVQKFRWREPSPEAEALLPIYDALLQAAEQGKITEGVARILIDRAAVGVHLGRWRLALGQDAGSVASECEALLLRARGMDRTVNDKVRTAEVLGVHARLSGSARLYDAALDDLRQFPATVSQVQATEKVLDVVAYFAHVQPSLWQYVLALCGQLEGVHPRYAYHNAAVALCQLGRPQEAMHKLVTLYQVDRDAFWLAFADPDLKPLWALGGSQGALPSSPHVPKR